MGSESSPLCAFPPTLNSSNFMVNVLIERLNGEAVVFHFLRSKKVLGLNPSLGIPCECMDSF